MRTTTATTNPFTRLAEIVAEAESRFIAVGRGLRRLGELHGIVAEAETRYRTDFTEDSLAALVRAKGDLQALESALGGDGEDVAESERLSVLHQPTTYEALAEALEIKLQEIERLIVGRREVLAREVSAYVLRGGLLEDIAGYQAQFDPLPTQQASANLRDALNLHHSLTGALNRCRGMLVGGGANRIDPTSNPSELITHLIGLTQNEIPVA